MWSWKVELERQTSVPNLKEPYWEESPNTTAPNHLAVRSTDSIRTHKDYRNSLTIQEKLKGQAFNPQI